MYRCFFCAVDTTVGHVDDSDHTLKIVVEGTTVPGGHVVVPLSVLDFLSPLSGPSSLPVVSASDFRQSAQSSVSGADKGVGPNGFVGLYWMEPLFPFPFHPYLELRAGLPAFFSSSFGFCITFREHVVPILYFLIALLPVTHSPPSL